VGVWSNVRTTDFSSVRIHFTTQFQSAPSLGLWQVICLCHAAVEVGYEVGYANTAISAKLLVVMPLPLAPQFYCGANSANNYIDFTHYVRGKC